MAGKIKNGIIFLLVCCIAAVISVTAQAAQEPVFRLDMDSLNLQKGVSSNIVVSLVNADEAKIINIEGLENFDTLSQSQSTSTTIVNNQVTSQVDMYYTIMPKTTGQFELKANISYNGNSYQTNALQVTVTEGADNTQGSASDLFVRTVLSDTDMETYLGEKIAITYELYSRYEIDGYGFLDYMSIDGAVTKDMDLPDDSIRGESVYIDGNRYVKYIVKELIIDPIKTGVCTIPAFNLQVNVITDSGMGGFGAFFRSSTPMYIQSDKKELLVKPLPSEGKPNNFSGIVGELKLEGSYSRESMDYGDSLALKIEAYGSCNLDSIKNIAGSGIPDITLYETQKNTIESIKDYRYHVQKEFEIIMIPEKTGMLQIEPISISYFNPDTGKYETAEIPGTTIEVTGEMPQQSTGSSSLSNTSEQIIINQLSYASASEGYFNLQIKKEIVYAVLTALAALLILSASAAIIIHQIKKQNKELKALYKKLLDSKDTNEIYNIFNTMIKNCYNLNLKASSQSAIRASLPDNALAEQVTGIMDYIESDKAHEENAPTTLKENIKPIYKEILRKF